MHLYVADAAHGVLADLDTQQLVVTRTARLQVGGNAHDAVSITAAPGAVFVARGSVVTAVSSTSLHSGRPWHIRGIVAGVQTAPTGNDLYVATRNRVLEVDPADGHTVRTMRTPRNLGISHVGYTLPDTGITNYQCAC
jgi:hypothetical protein